MTLPTTPPDEAPPGFPVKLWFVHKRPNRRHVLLFRWARERPQTYLLERHLPSGRKTVQLADAHHTATEAARSLSSARVRMARRFEDRAIEMREDADDILDAIERVQEGGEL